MVALLSIIKILKDKRTYICIFLMIIVLLISSMAITIVIKNNNIKKLNIKIEKLEEEIILKGKELQVQTNKEFIYQVFTNSDTIIERIEVFDLSYEAKQALISISNDYFKSLPKWKN